MSTELLTNLLTVVVLAFVGSRLVGGVRLLGRSSVREHVVEIVRGLRLRHFLMAPVVLAAVLVVATALVQIPGLSFGWWTAIGGEGNPVIGATDATSGGVLEWLIPLIFLTLLIPALPLFAEREEQMFRQGAEHWSTGRRVRRAVEFGLAHALIGIPIGVALALSIGGLYFIWRYLKGGIVESTRAHLAYNLEVVVLVMVLVVGSAWSSG
jgi:hypothetical protein